MQRGGRAIKEEEGTTFEQLKQRASAAPLPHLAQSSGDKFVVGDRRGGGRRRPAQHSDKMVLKNRNMGMMGEKLSSILGPTYFAGFCIGALGAIVKRRPALMRRTMKLRFTGYLNELGKNASRGANQAAAGMFLYILVGKCTFFVLQEELEKQNEVAKSALYGFCAGMLYKCSAGLGPMFLSAAIGSTLSMTITYLYETQRIKFKIRI